MSTGFGNLYGGSGRPGYVVGQRRRRQVEEVFRWMKTVGGVRKVRQRGREKVDWIFTLTAAVNNLSRIRTLCLG